MSLEKKGVSLQDYLRIVQKRRRIIAAFFICTFSLVMLVTFMATPQYKGTTEVIIEKADSDVLAGGYRSGGYDPEFYETQVQLIQSHAVARRVVKMLSLEDTYATYLGEKTRPAIFESLLRWAKKGKNRALEVLNPGDSSGSEAEPVLGAAQSSRLDRIAGKIRREVEVQPVPDSRIVAINFYSPNPEFSALVANALAKAYLEETLEMKMEHTRRTLEWMTRKAEEERSKLDQAEERTQEFMRDNNLVTLENKVAVLPEQLSQVSTELVRAQTAREKAEALYEKVKRVSDNPEAAETIPAIASDPAFRTLQTQILQAEQRVMELSGKYGRKHPAMIKAVGDLNVLKRKKEQEISRIIQSIKNEFELARTNEQSLRAQLKRSESEAQRVNEKFIQYQALNRETETNRQLYDALLEKIKEQSITGENQPMVKFWVVEEARVPGSPEKPDKAINALLGLMVGLFGGVGLAFFAEYLDNTVKDPEEAETILGTPVLSAVPVHKDKKAITEVMIHEPRSVFAESYKTLRTALLLSTSSGPPQKIVVTSSLSGEGKTTTAINLAFALAQSGKQVLLIDGDLRKPRLHKIFRKRNKNGLSTYLAGRDNGEEMLSKGPIANLTLVTSGPIPPNPSELLSASRMSTLLESLEDRFDIIICDSPPLLSVSDARVLSRLFDGTILVAQGGQTTYETARRALKSLQNVQAHVLGLVINALDSKKEGYYYHAYYSAYEEEQKTAIASDRLDRVVGYKEG